MNARLPLSLCACLLLSATMFGSESLPDHGLIVRVGGELDGALKHAASAPVLTLQLLPEAAVDAARKRIREAGLAGQVTVRPLSDALPLIDNLATAVVLDPAAAHLRGEAERVLSPRGLLLQGGQGWTKPVPDAHDDWPQYFYDGNMSDVSEDRAVKPVRGLQWTAGPVNKGIHGSPDTHNGLRIGNGVLLQSDKQSLVARDAFNGLVKWRRDDFRIHTATRYALLIDTERDRVWCLPTWTDRKRLSFPAPHLKAIDLHTGEDIMELESGFTIGQQTGKPRQHLDKFGGPRTSRAQVRLEGPHLLVAVAEDLAVHDADSGRLLWKTRLENGQFHTPIIKDGVVYVVEGAQVKAAAYTHWPMGQVARITAFDAATGSKKWSTDPQTDPHEIAAYSLTCHRGQLALGVRLEKPSPKPRSTGFMLILDAQTGKQLSFVDLKAGDRFGVGHSHLRIMGHGDDWRVNTTGTRQAIPLASVTDQASWRAPATGEGIGKGIKGILRVVACTVWRGTPDYIIGAGSVIAADGSAFWMHTASRTSCDIGSFPASGMLFQETTGCGCQPYLQNMNAMHGQDVASAGATSDGDRLQLGSAKPAAATASTDAWPMFRQSPHMGSWNRQMSLKGPLREQWRQQATATRKQHPDLRAEWRSFHLSQSDTMTGFSVAEGVVVGALVQEGVVKALAADSGQVLWTRSLDGRIDSQPTIHQGAVYVGTHAGAVYALNRDSGATIWRFQAAPADRMLVANGQLASVWPALGRVVPTNHGLLVQAGRHTAMDGGTVWYLLDPASGAIRHQGRFTSEQLTKDSVYWHFRAVPDSKGVVPSLMTPLVTDHEHFFSSMGQFVLKNGSMVPWVAPNPKAHAFEKAYSAPVVVTGRTSPIGPSMTGWGGGKEKWGGSYSGAYVYEPGDDRYATAATDNAGAQLTRGGRPSGEVHLMQRLASPKQAKVKGGKQFATFLWSQEKGVLGDEKLVDGGGYRAFAGCANRLFLALTRDRALRKGGQTEPTRHRLIVLDMADGAVLQNLDLPAPPVGQGISAAQGSVYVACVDGSVVCFAAE